MITAASSPGQAPEHSIGRRWGLHLAGIVAVPGCLAAGVFELSRAREGNQLSWAYAFEWPMFAVIVIYVWVRLAREFAADGRRAHAAPSSPASGVNGAAADAVDPDGPDDPQLRAWQEYLAALHAADPPGGPARGPATGPTRGPTTGPTRGPVRR